MEKKSSELSLLHQENVLLKLKVVSLEGELASLNENTIVESMNDMKVKYEELMKTSVCMHRFLDLQRYYKEACHKLIALDQIINLIYQNTLTLEKSVENMIEAREPNDNFFNQRIFKEVASIQDRLELLLEIVALEDGDKWVDSPCQLHFE
jgi:hypothetical protein